MKGYDSFFDGSEFFGALGINNLGTPLPELPPSDTPVNGFHVLSTKPYLARGNTQPFGMRETDIAVARLSCLAWKRFNGNIYLITDRTGENYIKSIGLDGYYDGIFSVLDGINLGIDHKKFWSAGKIEALSILKTPLAIIDLDMMIRQPLRLSDSDITVSHREYLDPEVYPPFEYFGTAPSYRFPAEWKRQALPLNSSFMYFSEDSFKDYYVKCAVEFMQAERNTPDDRVKCACFAEQRILAECAAAKNIKVNTLLELEKLGEPQTVLIHTWNAKSLISSEKSVRERFFALCEKEEAQLLASFED